MHFGKTREFSKDREMPSRFIPVAHFTNTPPPCARLGFRFFRRMESFDSYCEPRDPLRIENIHERRRTPGSLLTINRTATSQVGVARITPSRREPRRYRASIESVHRSNRAEPGGLPVCQPSPSCHLRASGPGVRRSRKRPRAYLRLGQKALRPHCRVAHSDAVFPSLMSFASLRARSRWSSIFGRVARANSFKSGSVPFVISYRNKAAFPLWYST